MLQLYPRSPDLVWLVLLHGSGCLSARAIDTGFPTVVRRLCLGLGFAVTPPTWPGSRVSAFGYGIWLRPATPAWGLWCVRLGSGLAVTPPFLA